MNKPLISVVVPIYKVEQYLRRCLDSIVNQSYSNLEIILVDDGSPDNCPKICDEYALKDNRIKVIHKENGGLSDARNRGIKEATGEYIGFVDSDDYIDEEMYEYLYGLIKKYDADISICGHKKVFNSKEISYGSTDERLLNNIEALKLLAEDKIVFNYACDKLYKLSLFTNNGIEYPVGKIMEDICTTYKVFEKSNRIILGNKNYYNYYQREDSISSNKDAHKFIAKVENMKDRYEHFINVPELEFFFFRSYYYTILSSYVENNKKLNKYLDEKRLLYEVRKVGKNKNFLNKLSLIDKCRYIVFKVCKPIYILIMRFRRIVIK